MSPLVARPLMVWVQDLWQIRQLRIVTYAGAAYAAYHLVAFLVYFGTGRAIPVRPDERQFTETREVSRRHCRALPGYDAVVRHHFIDSDALTPINGPGGWRTSALDDVRRWLRTLPGAGLLIGENTSNGWIPFDQNAAVAQELAFRRDNAPEQRPQQRRVAGSTPFADAAAPQADGAVYSAEAEREAPRGTARYASLTLERQGEPTTLAEALGGATMQSLVRCRDVLRGASLDPRLCHGDAAELCALYPRVMAAAVAFQPFPLASNLKIAQIGVGGGGFSNFLGRHLGQHLARFDLVDVEPACFEAAVKDLGLDVSKVQGTVQFHPVDALAFLRGASGVKYDALFVDTFVGSEVPEHLTSRAFLDACRTALSSTGSIAFNTPAHDRHFVAMVEDVWGRDNVFVARVPKSSNVVVLAAGQMPSNGMDKHHLVARCTDMSHSLNLPYDVGAHLPMAWRLW